MRLAYTERARQLAHTLEAIALCDHVATQEELTAAQETLARDPVEPQAQLVLRPK